MFEQLLPFTSVINVWKHKRRICNLILGLEGLICFAGFFNFSVSEVIKDILYIYIVSFNYFSALISSTKFYVDNGSSVVFSNKTLKWTYKYLIFAVDGGTPKRGGSIPLSITFDVSCVSTGGVVVNPVSGEVFFRAPGLTGSIYRKCYKFVPA